MRAFSRMMVAVMLAAMLPVAAKAQGALRVTTDASLNTLDPNKMAIGEEYVPAMWIFNNLVRLTADGKLEPELAKSWTASDDLQKWTFKLVKGVKFHDGREMTADDVVFTFERIADKNTASPVRNDVALIEQVSALDPYTVEFRLNIPYADLPSLMSERLLKIVPREHAAELATNPIGTGPFRFKSYAPGDRLVLEKNPDYFEKGKPKLDSITLLIMPEPQAQAAALQAGDVDLLWNVPLENIKTLESDPSIVVDTRHTGSWDMLVMNNEMAPFTDVRVRRAISLALDKQALMEFATFGHGAPTHSPIPPTSPYFNKSIPFRTDPAEAKKLLAEAGYPNGFSVDLYTPANRPTRDRLGAVVRQMLQPIGVKVNLQRIQYSRYGSEIMGKKPFYIDGLFARPSLDGTLYPFFKTGGARNIREWHFSNQEVDKLLDQTRLTRDEEKRRELYFRLQQYIVEEVPGVIAYVTDFSNAYTRKLKGFETSPYAWLDLRDAYLEK